MTDCPFCKIIAGELPSSIVYQDQTCLAVMDIQPINPGHLLILPKQHREHLGELDPEISGHLLQIAQKLARALTSSGIRSEGFNLLMADGKAAGQDVPHVHLHLIPRYPGDGFEFKFSSRYFELPTRDELDKNAFFIKQALETSSPGNTDHETP